MKNLDSVLKGRDITLPTKVHIVKAMGFLVVMYRCESMTRRIPKHRRIDAFELVVLERTLERPISMKYLSLYDKIFYMISSVTMDHKVVILLSYYEKYYEKKNRILLLNNYCRLLSKHKVRHCPWGVIS